MTQKIASYDPRLSSRLDDAVRSLIENSGERPWLGASLGYLISGHLASDFEWSTRRWIDTVDMLSLSVEETTIRGAGALWWGDADNIGGNQRPEPVAVEIAYDAGADAPVVWYEVTLWSDGSRRRITPDGVERRSLAVAPHIEPLAAIVVDESLGYDTRYGMAHAVARIGPSGIEWIGALLESIDVEGRRACARALQRAAWSLGETPEPLVRALDGDDPEARATAAVTIWTLDDERSRSLRERALPSLVETLGLGRRGSTMVAASGGRIVGAYTSDVGLAIQALAGAWREHPEVVGLLTEALESPFAREAAARALGRIGPAAEAAIPVLESLGSNPTIGYTEMPALIEISEPHARIFAALLCDLDDPQAHREIARIFTRAHPRAARWAAPELFAALEAPDRDVRIRAEIIRALGRAEPRDDEIRAVLRRQVPWLAAAFSEEHDGDRRWEPEALEAIGPDADDAVPILIEAARRGGDVAEDAVEVLGAIGPAAAPAVETLADLLTKRSDDDLVAHKAAKAIPRIGPAAIPALVPLLAWEHSNDHALSFAAYYAGGAIRDIGDDALPAVLAIRRGAPSSPEAVSALGWIGPIAVPELIRALDGDEPDVRAAAAAALYRVGPEAIDAVGRLAPLLHDEDEAVRMNAAEALAVMGPRAVPALAAAVRSVSSPDALARIARALGETGEETDAAVPALAALARHEDVSVRLAAVRSLGLLGPDASSEPALDRALGDPDPEVAAAARRALAASR